jgi:HEPN domain-containing protein
MTKTFSKTIILNRIRNQVQRQVDDEIMAQCNVLEKQIFLKISEDVYYQINSDLYSRAFYFTRKCIRNFYS